MCAKLIGLVFEPDYQRSENRVAAKRIAECLGPLFEQIPIDITKFLKNDTPVSYKVMNEQSSEGKIYARIVDGSLKSKDQPAQQELFTKEAVAEPPKKANQPGTEEKNGDAK